MIAHTSMFAQMISIIDRHEFQRSVNKHEAEKCAKGFSTWDQFVSMLFCQAESAGSLREIVGGLASAAGKLSHLGMEQAPARSTLSYANAHRSWRVFEDVFNQVLLKCQHAAFLNGSKFRFKNKFLTLDASVIELCATMFDWAKYRSTKGAVKLHLLLDNRGCLPSWAVMTEGNVHEVNIARKITFEKGTILAIDRGYWDYALFGKWTDGGVYFVTRAKDNMACEVVDGRDVPEKGNVYEDSTIELTGIEARKDCPHKLRRILCGTRRRRRNFTS